MSEIQVDTVSEKTAASGVTVDGVVVKDSGLTIPSGGTLTIASGGTLANSGTVTGLGDNTPSFQAYLSSDQTSVTHATWTKIQFDSEDYDTAGGYDNATNFQYTVPASEGGKYYVWATVQTHPDTVSSGDFCKLQIRVNAETDVTARLQQYQEVYGTYSYWYTPMISGVITLAAADTVKCYIYPDDDGTNPWTIIGNANRVSRFGLFKLTGV